MDETTSQRAQLAQALWNLRRGIARCGGPRANQLSLGRMLTDPDYRARMIAAVRRSELEELRTLAEEAARHNAGRMAELPVSWDAAGRSELDIEELSPANSGRRGASGPSSLLGAAGAVMLFALAGGLLSYFFSEPLAAVLAGRERVSGTIDRSMTWRSDRTYVLEDVVYVTGDNTLTIEPGTTILGEPGSALIVTRQAELRAHGTRSRPVVFTSAKPAGERARGDWGGVALLGSAPVNAAKAHLEGVPEDDPRGEFGGGAAEDSCGVISHVRIEFAGHEVAADVELNGLTLAGCGRATVVRHVQVHMGLDDGVEVFGGTVNLERVVVSRAADDGLDWDLGWTGNGQFIVIQQSADAGDNAIEADNNRDRHAATPRSAPTLANLTLIGSRDPRAGQRAMTLRRGTAGDLRNLIVTGFPLELLDVRDGSTATMAAAGRLRFAGLMAHGIGAGGERFALDEPFGSDVDDDNRFDEADFLQASGARLGEDPRLPAAAFDIAAPRFSPAADSPATRGAVAVPQGEFWQEGADYLGALEPGRAEDWLDGWTAFPEH